MSTLGRLHPVDLRGPWPTEAGHFTPWLAQEDNLSLLSETLGIDLELEAVEQNVGPFRADILCKDTLSGDWVLIENQLERTDHTHLGQLLTYAAGLDAVTIVWIAARVADEHRAAMDWLNEKTEAGVRFFALEVELWRIGDSPPAPKFNIVSQPNSWSRSTSAGKRAVEAKPLTQTQQLQLAFWEVVETRLAEAGGPPRAVKPQPASWLSHSIGRAYIGLNGAMNTREGWLRCEIYLGGQAAKGYFHLLHERRAQIEAALGTALDWQRLDDKNDARICITRGGFDPSDAAKTQDHATWLVDRLTAFHKVFAPVIRDISPEEAQAHI